MFFGLLRPEKRPRNDDALSLRADEVANSSLRAGEVAISSLRAGEVAISSLRADEVGVAIQRLPRTLDEKTLFT